MTTNKKTRATKENKVQKYNLQIPIALDKKEQLEELAKELDLSLAQYCRCVLLKHCKNESTQDLFSVNTVTTVGEQPTVGQGESFVGEQSTEPKEEVQIPKHNKKFGAK